MNWRKRQALLESEAERAEAWHGAECTCGDCLTCDLQRMRRHTNHRRERERFEKRIAERRQVVR